MSYVYVVGIGLIDIGVGYVWENYFVLLCVGCLSYWSVGVDVCWVVKVGFG